MEKYEKYFKAGIIIITLWLALDGVTTWFVFSKLGNHQAELNPLMKYVMDSIGMTTTLILTRVIALSAVYLLYEPMKSGGKKELAVVAVYILFLIIMSINNLMAVWKVLL